MPLAVDHVFVTTTQPDAVVERLVDLGLREGPANAHPGQGTACRRFFFARGYLEILYLVDEAEARGPTIAPMRLADRCLRTTADLGRVGFALVGEEDLPFGTWAYRPPYLPAALEIRIAHSSARDDEPLLFAMPPGVRAPEQADAPRMSAIVLGPRLPANASPELQAFVRRGPVAIDPAVQGVGVVLDAGRRTASLMPLVPLHLRW
jgi:hypothetical protein